jgi:hypothetical protein
VCHAEPFADGTTSRESFDLLRVDGSWFCEMHRPAKRKRATRVADATPIEALSAFEDLLKTENAHLEEAVAGCDDDVAIALKEHSEEIGRGLSELRKAITEQTPPRAEKAPENKRARLKSISARERDHEGQGDLITDQKIEDA